MRALVVYESMYGNTHEIADKIAEGLRPHGEVHVVPVGGATVDEVSWADLVVVGGPTHVHSLPSGRSREGAKDAVTKPGSDLHLDPDAEGPGLRDWFKTLPKGSTKRAAAFDTRIDLAAVLTGRASHSIKNRLARHGYTMVADAESFLVDKQSHLGPGEAERAGTWGQHLGETYAWPPVVNEPGFREGQGRTPCP
jgi:hypothetical protein